MLIKGAFGILVILVAAFGNGRIFYLNMCHDDCSQSCSCPDSLDCRPRERLRRSFAGVMPSLV